MRCDLANMLLQVRAILKRAARSGSAYEAAGLYVDAIEQLRDDVLQVRAGTATLEEFADCYMLNPRTGATATGARASHHEAEPHGRANGEK